MDTRLKDFVRTLSEYEEWFHESNADTFEKVGEFLFKKNLKEYEVKYVLSTLYSAVADEFGGG